MFRTETGSYGRIGQIPFINFAFAILPLPSKRCHAPVMLVSPSPPRDPPVPCWSPRRTSFSPRMVCWPSARVNAPGLRVKSSTPSCVQRGIVCRESHHTGTCRSHTCTQSIRMHIEYTHTHKHTQTHTHTHTNNRGPPHAEHRHVRRGNECIQKKTHTYTRTHIYTVH
jgi:hypothetical protein